MSKLGRKRSASEKKPSGDGPVVIEAAGGWRYRAKIVGADATHTGVAEYVDRNGQKQRTHKFKLL